MNEKIMKCPMCSAPIDYLESGAIRFDSSRYHTDAVKKLSEISCLKGQVVELVEGIVKTNRMLDKIIRENKP